jgi:hypothetical protein
MHLHPVSGPSVSLDAGMATTLFSMLSSKLLVRKLRSHFPSPVREKKKLFIE